MMRASSDKCLIACGKKLDVVDGGCIGQECNKVFLAMGSFHWEWTTDVTVDKYEKSGDGG
jgi:hypothetical protein